MIVLRNKRYSTLTRGIRVVNRVKGAVNRMDTDATNKILGVHYKILDKLGRPTANFKKVKITPKTPKQIDAETEKLAKTVRGTGEKIKKGVEQKTGAVKEYLVAPVEEKKRRLVTAAEKSKNAVVGAYEKAVNTPGVIVDDAISKSAEYPVSALIAGGGAVGSAFSPVIAAAPTTSSGIALQKLVDSKFPGFKRATRRLAENYRNSGFSRQLRRIPNLKVVAGTAANKIATNPMSQPVIDMASRMI